MNEAEQFAQYGEVEAIYRPSNGQTFAGTLVCAAFAAGGFAAAVFGCGLDVTNRVCGVLFGLIFLGFAAWLFRLRKWRFVMFADGLVQVRPGGVDQLAWADVREVIQMRQKGFGDRTVSVTVAGGTAPVVVNPVNLRSRAKLFERLLEAARQRGIPIRVEWQEVR